MEEKLKNIPESWEIFNFDDCFVSINPAIKIKQKSYKKYGKIPIIDQGIQLIGGYTDSIENAININLPVIIFGDHTRIVKYVDFKFAAGADGIKIIKNIGSISLRFYYYFLKYYSVELPNKGYARHFQYVKKIIFPLPPLNEQKRIVEKIDKLFSDLDNGVANLKKAQQQLKLYRQALLKNAFEGKLTEQWRKENNPEPAEKLLERIKQERQKRYEQELAEWKEAVKKWEGEGKKGKKPKKPKDYVQYINDEVEELSIPKFWSIELLGNICQQIEKTNSKKENPEKEFFYIDISSIDNSTNQIIDFKKHKWANAPSRAQQIIKVNDTLFSTVRTYLKNIAFVSKKILDNEICSTGFVVFRPENSINPKYIFFHSLSNRFLNSLNKLQSGTSYPAIRDEDAFMQPIPICSIEEQNQIVSILEEHFSVIDKLEEEIKKALKKSEILRQSILKKAFEGKLVPQDPSDEPASELLKRIKKEKEKYLAEQKEKKKKPVKRKQMDKNLSIEEVLKKSKEPLPAKDVWQQSKHKDDIEAFYAELKKIQHNIKEIKKGTESLLELKR